MSEFARGRVALVVDDDAAARTLAGEALTRDGVTVVAASTAEEARTVLARRAVDVVVLDLGLPDESGLTLLTGIRETGSTPVVIVSGFADIEDRVVGLRLGADDYLTKPFSPSELAARVHSVLRRSVASAPVNPVLTFGDGLVIDVPAREVSRHGTVIDLRPREFDVLAHLAGHPRQVFSRDDLLRIVWNSSSEWQTPATVTEHVRKLRLAVEIDPNASVHVITVRGVGYRFDP